MSQVVPFPQSPTEAIADPSGSSTLPAGLPKRPQVFFHITDLSLSAKALMWAKLKGYDKICICRECDRPSSNWDSMVFHYLKEHFRVCLVCPECRMSYSDASNFHHHSREIHNLLFYQFIKLNT